MYHGINMLPGESLVTKPPLLLPVSYASRSIQAHLLPILHIEMNAAPKNIVNNSSSQHTLHV